MLCQRFSIRIRTLDAQKISRRLPRPSLVSSSMLRGRFQQETAASMRRLSESVSFDWRLFKFDILGSIAHAKALHKAGLLTVDELAQIETGLLGIEKEIAAGTFEFRAELEAVHMNIEAELTKRIGAAGAKLHTARSRNDQVALDLRLYLRNQSNRFRHNSRRRKLCCSSS